MLCSIFELFLIYVSEILWTQVGSSNKRDLGISKPQRFQLLVCFVTNADKCINFWTICWSGCSGWRKYLVLIVILLELAPMPIVDFSTEVSNGITLFLAANKVEGHQLTQYSDWHERYKNVSTRFEDLSYHAFSTRFLCVSS